MRFAQIAQMIMLALALKLTQTLDIRLILKKCTIYGDLRVPSS